MFPLFFMQGITVQRCMCVCVGFGLTFAYRYSTGAHQDMNILVFVYMETSESFAWSIDRIKHFATCIFLSFSLFSCLQREM